jgi:hypothetical protein
MMSSRLRVTAALRFLSPAIVSCFFLCACCSTPTDKDIQDLVQRGEFTRANAAIAERLAEDTALTPSARLALAFERDRLARIRFDFPGEEQKVRDFVLRWIPGAQDTDFQRWEASGALEMMMIDGKKCSFNSAAHPVHARTARTQCRDRRERNESRARCTETLRVERHPHPVGECS